MTQIVIMPGGFHPFHAGHAALYNSARKAFPGAEVYVAATNDTSTRPFPFAVKEKLAKLAGVEPGHFVQVKSPFRAEEITSQYDPAQDQLIFVRSEKDATKQPQAGGVKKDGSPSYLQPLSGQPQLAPFSQHAYMAYLPTVEFGPGMTSATEIRTAWPQLNDKRKTALVMSLYPTTQSSPALAANVVKLLDAAIVGADGVAESSLEDRLKKYIRPVVKTTPKIERTTNPAGRTTDHVEWKVTGPTGEINRYKSKKEAQAHYDSFSKQDVAEGLNPTEQKLLDSGRDQKYIYIKGRHQHEAAKKLVAKGLAEKYDDASYYASGGEYYINPFTRKQGLTKRGLKVYGGTLYFKDNGVAEASDTMQRYGQKILKRAQTERSADLGPKKEEPPASSGNSSISTRDLIQQLRKPKKKGVAEGLNEADASAVQFRTASTDNYQSSFTVTAIADGKTVGHFSFFRDSETDEVHNQAEVTDDVRGKGYGKALLLKAIEVANDHGLGFQEDSQSLSRAQSRVYDSLYDAGWIVDADGYWFLTPEGEQELSRLSTVQQGMAEGWKDVVAGGAMALGALGANAQSMPNINVQQLELTNKYYNTLVQRAKEDGRELDRRALNFLRAKAEDAAAQKFQQTAPSQSKPQQGFPTQGSERRVSKDIDNFESQGMAEAAKKCPPATQDITLNLKNRQKAIDEYGYGPLNPDMPNTKFWMKKVDEWNLDSAEEAQQSLCGNCAAFDVRQDTLDCIAQGIDSDSPKDAAGVIDAGELGYCKFLKFKCASRRTCDAWVTGGPLTDKPVDENQGWAATYNENSDYIEEKWSAKYKSSINCANPKGFSQKAHCAGRKK